MKVYPQPRQGLENGLVLPVLEKEKKLPQSKTKNLFDYFPKEERRLKKD